MRLGFLKRLDKNSPPTPGSGWVVVDGDKEYQIYPPYNGSDFHQALKEYSRNFLEPYSGGGGNITVEYKPYNYTDSHVTITKCLTIQDKRDSKLEELLK